MSRSTTMGSSSRTSPRSYVRRTAQAAPAMSSRSTIVASVVERFRPGDALDGLRHIGIDELSYRRHHEYITVVIDHVAKRVVWARPGKDAETLGEFFKELGLERSAQLEAVTVDMSGA